MKTKSNKFFVAFVTGLTMFGSVIASAADAAPAAAEGADAAAPDPTSFWDIAFGGDAISSFIWILIFGTSAATVALIIDGFVSIKAAKIMPPELIDSVKSALDEGDLAAALEACEDTPGPLSNILLAGFNNVSEGFEVIMDAVANTAEIESEKLMQRVNYLNLCGSIAPMLGLMGTVTGMVAAFASLGSASGAAKQAQLAMNISQALYTTAFGLLISVPAILAFTFVRNNASKIILSMELLTFDLIKVLRGAEVEDEEYEEEYE
jgi:biopolymer transport protein ExbB